MIVLRRLDGSRLALNADQIERLDEAQATVVTMMNGATYIVAESVDTVIDMVVEYQARIRSDYERPVRRRARKPRPNHLAIAGEESAPEEG